MGRRVGRDETPAIAKAREILAERGYDEKDVETILDYYEVGIDTEFGLRLAMAELCLRNSRRSGTRQGAPHA